MFEEVEKAPEYDFDYLRDMDELPRDRLVCLCGETDTKNIRKSQ